MPPPLAYCTSAAATTSSAISLPRPFSQAPVHGHRSARLGFLSAPTSPVSVGAAPPTTCTDFALALAKLMHLHSPSTVQLTLHCWRRIQGSWQTLQLVASWRAGPLYGQRAMIGTCLWLAAKLEEQRKGLPSSTQLAACLGASMQDVRQLELQVNMCVLRACMRLRACIYVLV